MYDNEAHETDSQQELLPHNGMMNLYKQVFLGSLAPFRFPSSSPSGLYLDVAAFAMYPKWFLFILTLLSCLFLMASAAPVTGADVAPVKRLKQFQLRRPSAGDDSIEART